MTASTPLPLSNVPASPGSPRLPGDLVVWLFVGLELATFGLLFLSFAFGKLRQPAMFAAGQATLNPRIGAINTLLLITASACAAHALHGVRHDRCAWAARWLMAALAWGCGFIALKSFEYWEKLRSGIDLAGNDFYMLYMILTGFHFMHVLAGCVIFALLLRPCLRGHYGRDNCLAMESGCVFWHMVDLLWIVLFPLVYLMH